MDDNQLRDKYTVLMREVVHLTEENKRLKARLASMQAVSQAKNNSSIMPDEGLFCGEVTDNCLLSEIHNESDSILKIRLFMSLFKSGQDVYTMPKTNLISTFRQI